MWPADFSPIFNHEIVFQPGEPQNKQLELNITDDTIVEAMEMFYVMLTTLDSHVTIGQWNKTKIQIIDNDSMNYFIIIIIIMPIIACLAYIVK